MLTATLSKAGLGLVAFVAVGGLENLPALASWIPAQTSATTSIAHIFATDPTTPRHTNHPSPSFIDVTARSFEKPAGVIDRLLPKKTCNRAASEADLVVAGDRITLRVFAQAANNAERFERRDLSGTFTVDAAGQIAVPGIGRLPIAGQGLACLEAPVIAALKAEMDISATVTASFDARPPILVQGSVISPGSYEFTPNLSVGALLAKAGAGGGTADTALYRALNARRHELKTLRADLILRQARMTAQRAGAPDLSLPPDLGTSLRAQLGADRLNGETAVLQAALDEAALRKARDAAIRADLESTLETAKVRRNLVRSRYEQLSQRRDQLEINIGADCRGRCGTSRRYDELRLDNLNGRLGDLDLTVEDAESRVTEVRHALERHDRDVAFSYAQADSKLALSVAETLADRNALEAEIGSVEAQIMDLGGTTDHSIRVERGHGAQMQTLRVHKNFLLLPGDLVIIGPPDDAILASAQGSRE
ncbi:polysaccharide biosynthesis/export family protein [Sulfitobacter sp. 916]|uniref:polysaccharide biosynthesis/export family protein n=1 Tax=Sulfitobacter sp. 916 TaxID=3368559 RepID=UPI003745FAE0